MLDDAQLLELMRQVTISSPIARKEDSSDPLLNCRVVDVERLAKLIVFEEDYFSPKTEQRGRKNEVEDFESMDALKNDPCMQMIREKKPVKEPKVNCFWFVLLFFCCDFCDFPGRDKFCGAYKPFEAEISCTKS